MQQNSNINAFSRKIIRLWTSYIELVEWSSLPLVASYYKYFCNGEIYFLINNIVYQTEDATLTASIDHPLPSDSLVNYHNIYCRSYKNA